MAKKKNTQREDGRYAVQVYIGMVDGKRKYKTVYGKTQKEANIKADEIKVAMRKGVDVASSDSLFKDVAASWLITKNMPGKEERCETLKPRIALWVDFLGDIPISRIRPFDIQTTLITIAKKNPYTNAPMAKKTIKEYIQVVNAIFKFAQKNNAIMSNPAEDIEIPFGAETSKRRALTEEERQRVMEFEHRAKPSAMLMMLSGLRRGEATALMWNDIDFVNNKITVTKSYNFKQKEFKTPKNGKARVVSVPQMLIDYLQTLPKISPFVLTNAKGGMMTEDSWKRLYQSYMTDMNIQYGFGGNAPNKFSPIKLPMVIATFTPHELRHTFCTIMFEAGVDAMTAKEQMGHSDIQTTLSIYTHLLAKHKDTQVEKIDAFLAKCKSDASQDSVNPLCINGL